MTTKEIVNNLINAINDNAELINVGTENGQDHYENMVRLQYIADELGDLRALVAELEAEE